MRTQGRRSAIRGSSNVIIEAITVAEDPDSDLPIKFLLTKESIHRRMFVVHDNTGVATPFVRLGVHILNNT